MIRKLVWESNFFDIEVGELDSAHTNIGESELDLYDLIIVKQEVGAQVEEIHGFTESFSEVKRVYSKKLKSLSEDIDGVYDYDSRAIDNKSLYNLAYLSGHHSRFFLDKKFSSDVFYKLYALWIDNAINKSFDKKVFYMQSDENKVNGLLTLGYQGEEGNVGLFAVDENSQGQGLGAKLLSRAEQFCIDNEIKTLNIATQSSNIQACRFYAKKGYFISKELIIKHLWKN